METSKPTMAKETGEELDVKVTRRIIACTNYWFNWLALACATSAPCMRLIEQADTSAATRKVNTPTEGS